MAEQALGKFEGDDKDFPKVYEFTPTGPKADENTWHNHQDETTKQEIDKRLYKRFTHI